MMVVSDWRRFRMLYLKLMVHVALLSLHCVSLHLFNVMILTERLLKRPPCCGHVSICTYVLY